MVICYGALSQRNAFQKAKALDSQPYYDGALAYAYARAGDRAKAEQVVRDLDDRAKQRYMSADTEQRKLAVRRVGQAASSFTSK